MKVFFDMMSIFPDKTAKIYNLSDEMIHWMQGAFTKVVVSVNSEEEIYDLAKRATDLSIPHAVIIDNGLTEFHGNKTTTSIAIGPDSSERIDQLTAELPLI
jgi:PTH2 family peptidyl-tRNA hydrolase